MGMPSNLLEIPKGKEVKVRTPRRGRSKSIVVPGTSESGSNKNFPIGRLNNYTKTMKKHRGPLSMASLLESIDEEGLGSDKGQSASGSSKSVIICSKPPNLNIESSNMLSNVD